MKQLLLESPWIVATFGVALFVATLYGWLQSGRKEAVWVALALLCLTGVAVLVSNWIETDEERLRARIHAIAVEVENNRHAAVIAAIHPDATETVHRAQAELPNYRFKYAQVTRIHSIRFQETTPRRAIVEMNVMVDIESSIFSGRIPRFVEVELIEEQGKWLVYNYRHGDPLNRLQDPQFPGAP